MSNNPRHTKADSAGHDLLPFALVLSGGGARGYAHTGALQCLEEHGIRPAAVMGVSMGGLVGVTYALREDWFQALYDLNFAEELAGQRFNFYANRNPLSKLRFLLHLPKTVWKFFFGWGFVSISQSHALHFLEKLTQGKDLEHARIPVSVAATDLITGKRVILTAGNAARIIYASAALAGVFPPMQFEDYLLVDGAYADSAPIDAARNRKTRKVISIDVSQSMAMPELKNGFQALMRAVEICHLQHAHLRFEKSDLVLRPEFPRPIDTLDFSYKDECIAAGYRMILTRLPEIRRILRKNK